MPLVNKLAVFGWDNLGTLSTVTSNQTAQTAYPLTNLNSEAYGETWRGPTGTLTGVQLTFDLGASYSLAAFALAGCNFSASATMTVKSSTVSNFASTVVSSASISCFDTTVAILNGTRYVQPWGRVACYFDPSGPQSARYVRFEITDASNAYNYLEVAIPVIGSIFQAAVDQDLTCSRADKFVGEAGVEKTLRGHRAAFKALTYIEKAKLEDLERRLLRSGRVLVVPRPSYRETYLDEAIWASLEGPAEASPFYVGPALADERWTKTLTFREVEE